MMTDQQLSPVWVVIPAAGIGQRMESEHPKQYLKIHEKTLIEHTLDCFIHHGEVEGVVIVISSEDQYWESLNFSSKSKPVLTIKIAEADKSSRSDSVLEGLKYLKNKDNISIDSWVLIHDAARPCVSKSEIDSLLAIRTFGTIGGILATPVRDTMKRSLIKNESNTNAISHTESRENLWHALTPQMFRLGDLSKAMQQCNKQNITITDECSAIESIGKNPLIVEGSNNNIKVTYPSDIELAAYLIGKRMKEMTT